MSDLSTQPPAPYILLLETNTGQWKDAIINRALMLNAYEILMGTETLTSAGTDTAAVASFKARQSQLAGHIGNTLNDAHRALLKNATPSIAPNDAYGIWTALVNHFESKTTNTCYFAVQGMMALCKGDAGHENETYSAYGACCIRETNVLKNLLPAGATYTAGKEKCTCSFKQGFSARDLVDELTINMIVVGLGFEEKDRQLQSTLTHIGISSLDKILEELRKADTLIKSKALAEATSSSVDALTAKKRPSTTSKNLFDCVVHGRNTTHDTKDCKVVKGALEGAKSNKPKKTKDAKKAKDDDSTNTGSDAEGATQAAKLASPPCHQNSRSCTDLTWNADSGATAHMTPHREWIRNMEPCRVPVRLANDDVIWATGRGTVIFSPLIDGKPSESVVFKHVLYVPNLESNLFSVLSAVRRNKLKVVIEDGSVLFTKNGAVLFTGSIHRNVATLNGTTLDRSEQIFIAKTTRSLLHQRLGHIGKERLERLLKEELAEGIVVDQHSELSDICDHCLAGKQHRDPFPHLSEHRSTVLLGRIHSDVHGPLPKTPYGYRYWLTLIDDMSRYKRVYLLKKKSEVFLRFKEFVAEAERELGKKVKELRDDKGGEYMSTEFIQYCKENGISRQHTVKSTPQQNPVAERLNRTLSEGVIAMLNQANLPIGFWGQAVIYLTDILNATPSSLVSKTTSYEVWKRRKPDLKMYRVFGCQAFVHVQKKDRGPLDSHTANAYLLALTTATKDGRFTTL